MATTTVAPEVLAYLKAAAQEVLTRPQAAAYLSLRPQTLAKWACLGREGPRFFKHGKVVRYRKSDLDAWLEQHTVGGDK